MTKTQKIWFAIFAAMFLIPEILWGGLRSYIYGTLFPSKTGDLPLLFSIISFPQNKFFLIFVNLVSLIGIFGLIFVINKLQIKNKIIRFFILFLFGLIALATSLLALLQIGFAFSSFSIG
jgi:hypothetical protein